MEDNLLNAYLPDVRFGSKADMCTPSRCPLSAKSGRFSDECRSARQDNPDISELTRLRIDLD